MIVKVSTKLDASADFVWNTVKQSATLCFITRELLGFDRTTFPVEWMEGETIRTKLYLFGFLPLWKHELYFVKIEDRDREFKTKESGGIISVWNHRIKVQKLENSCIYTDEVEIKAGMLTPLVWFFCKWFYKYRQHRCKKLIEKTGNSTTNKQTLFP